MTTRENARQEGRVRFGAGERGDPGDAGPGLPDRLAAARERKGVDLARAERDTKIRVRYLSALESGDYRDLPGAVYTKGFLRNYALYLGLDPEDVLRQWRRERGEATAPEAGHRPAAAARRAGAAAELLAPGGRGRAPDGRRRPVLHLPRRPAAPLLAPARARRDQPGHGGLRGQRRDARPYRLAGTTSPGSIIEIATPGQEQPFRVTPLANGDWFLQVDLRRGQNRFDIKAVNPETKKESEDIRQVVINVPFLEILAPTLDGDPAGGGDDVRQRRHLGRGHDDERDDRHGHDRVPRRGGRERDAEARLEPRAPGPNRTVNVAGDGSFEFPPLELTTGRWAITVTATSEQGQTATQTRTIVVAFTRREPGREHPGQPSLDQGLGRRRARGPAQRPRHQRGPDADVHRRGVDRGSHRLVREHAFHAQRRLARDASARRACRRRGSSRRPTNRSRPSGRSHAQRPRRAGRAPAGHLPRTGPTVALAESCTGGLVASTITDVAGSSGYFLGGVVSYSNDAKTALLDVPQAALDAHGAVSAQVAKAMAAGAQARFGAALAASVTGVAGPDGGSDEKPVGLTYVGLADGSAVEVRRFTLRRRPGREPGGGGPRGAGVADRGAREAEAGRVTRSLAELGAGLSPARASRPIAPGERIHVLGIAGAGASAAALHAAAAGAIVTGCDSGGPSPYTAALEALGIPIAWSHHTSHVTDGPRPDRLAVTKALTAISPDHPELRAAAARGIPAEPWQQVIADAAHGRTLVAVAGTHGKSTTAGWLTWVLAETGADPSAFVGALLPASLSGGIPATARLGRGASFVVEADEYAGNFDPYRPDVVALTASSGTTRTSSPTAPPSSTHSRDGWTRPGCDGGREPPGSGGRRASRPAPGVAVAILGAELAQRPRAGADHPQRPALAPGEHAARQRGQQPGAQERGLAAPRRSDDGQQVRADQAGDELGHEPLAPEEVVRVVVLEAGQALERADRQRLRRRLRVRDRVEALARGLPADEAADQLGLERTQAPATARRSARRPRRRARPARPWSSRRRARAPVAARRRSLWTSQCVGSSRANGPA